MLRIGYIAALVGVSVDTIRKWEQRYSYPQPTRTKGGTRLYTQSDLEGLLEAKKLLDLGHKPSEVFSNIHSLPSLYPSANILSTQKNEHLNELLLFVENQHYDELQSHLEKIVLEKGVDDFIENYAAPFMRLVGNKWANRELQVFEEHSISATMQIVLNKINEQARFGNSFPTILSCTPPGEWHTLGLQMITACILSPDVFLTCTILPAM